LSSVVTAVIVLIGAGLTAFLWTNRTEPMQSVAPDMIVTTAAPAPPARLMANSPAVVTAPESGILPSVESPSGVLPSTGAAGSGVLAATSPSPLEDVISRAMPAVVRVESASGVGSGFFVAADTILTNVHVVGSNRSVTIRRPDGRTATARVETTAPEFDVAVMRITSPDPDQPTLTMGSGAGVRSGQEIIALGTPLGLQNTVTRGIVSAVRQVGGVTLIQTDAAINPGNSGGPLLDRAGLVVAITTIGMRTEVAQGLSFGVAIEHAQDLLAGRRPVAAGTPLSSLNQAMSGKPEPAASDSVRDEGGRVYEAAIAALERRADALDGQWASFKSACYQGRVAGAFEREWFAVLDSRAMQGAVSAGCEPSFADIRRAAQDIRVGVLGAEESARRSGVYPGTLRDVRRSHRLDGWDR
jgi:hypothetical protein